MEYRPLEMTIILAKGLKDVGHFSKMDVYVAVTISGDPRTEQKTPVDKDGGSSPSWNHTMKFTVDEAAAQMSHLNLVFQLRHERTLLGDKDIGEVHVPVEELLLRNAAGDGNVVEYPVRKPSGKAKGELKFSYKFGAVYKIGVQAGAFSGTSSLYPPLVTVYPNLPLVVGPYPPQAPPARYPHATPVFPPPPAGYPPAAPAAGGYGYPAYGVPPPPPAAGYPQMAPGYGYPAMQQPQQPPKKNRFGPGLGAGLVGGLIGGMLIGDMVADAGAYDAGYDAGFDDGGGFDF